MPRDELAVLAAFAVVAEQRSFTKAAVRLGVSTSAVSHSIRGLEQASECVSSPARHRGPDRRGRALPRAACPPFDGFFLYYPSRRHQPPALAALVDALRIDSPARRPGRR
jgi:DNA-binding transcriptional LysR family regulator